MQGSMSYESFVNSCNYPAAHQRKGQSAFNLLCSLRPDLSEQVRATPLDPFYQDEILPAFFSWVKEHWGPWPPEVLG